MYMFDIKKVSIAYINSFFELFCFVPLRKKKVQGMLKRHCKKLRTLATKSSCFIYNNKYYRQVDGVAMGSPLGPTLANVFLSHHETSWLENCPVQFKPVYYRIYVDDVIVLFKCKNHVNKFLSYMNTRHHNVEFTHGIRYKVK